MQHPLGLWPVSSPFLCTYGFIWRRPRVHRLPHHRAVSCTRRTGGYVVRRVVRRMAVTTSAARRRSGSEIESANCRSLITDSTDWPSQFGPCCLRFEEESAALARRRERRPRPPLNPTASRTLLCSTLLCFFSTTLAHTTVSRVTRAVGCWLPPHSLRWS